MHRRRRARQDFTRTPPIPPAVAPVKSVASSRRRAPPRARSVTWGVSSPTRTRQVARSATLAGSQRAAARRRVCCALSDRSALMPNSTTVCAPPAAFKILRGRPCVMPAQKGRFKSGVDRRRARSAPLAGFSGFQKCPLVWNALSGGTTRFLDLRRVLSVDTATLARVQMPSRRAATLVFFKSARTLQRATRVLRARFNLRTGRHFAGRAFRARSSERRMPRCAAPVTKATSRTELHSRPASRAPRGFSAATRQSTQKRVCQGPFLLCCRCSCLCASW